MKFLLLSVGKAHESFVREGVEQFSKRITHYYPMQWQLVAPPKQAGSLSAEQLKLQEGESILQQLKPDDFLVLLDERGKMLSSPALAQFIQQRANESTKQVVFLIGGAFGVSEPVFKRANMVWSLSPLVFPHQLVRLMLAEQVYRACTIIRGESYHHL
jgi:23S rRNA (pseudouridine1915-N3)-methyltransferase